MTIRKVERLVAVIGRKRYECVPSESCAGCAFERRCYRAEGRRFKCPEFNGYAVASDMEFIYKEIRE